MKRHIPLETAAILLLANPFLKQGICSEYVMVNCICRGLLDMWEARTEKYKMKNSCPQWVSNPGPSVHALSVELFRPDKYRSPKFELQCKLPVPRGRCYNDLSCIFLI